MKPWLFTASSETVWKTFLRHGYAAIDFDVGSFCSSRYSSSLNACASAGAALFWSLSK
ncbi:hypothetical protein [Bradyrhizobium rifense]|uniref:hypothetical protein n=1 Tax=Bradyrhizobium rifense TaxID=515499 RepID=UPI001652D06E|nr:hypothetical protein [Bradyrhizobium rifense]